MVAGRDVRTPVQRPINRPASATTASAERLRQPPAAGIAKLSFKPSDLALCLGLSDALSEHVFEANNGMAQNDYRCSNYETGVSATS